MMKSEVYRFVCHVRAFARECDSDGATYATIGARDQRPPAIQPAEALITCLAVIGLRRHRLRQPRRLLRLPVEFRAGILLRRVLHTILINGGAHFSLLCMKSVPTASAKRIPPV